MFNAGYMYYHNCPIHINIRIENQIPAHLLADVEMIVVGWFDEFQKRAINAFYKDGILYVSNTQDDERDMLDDIIHETAHMIEELYGNELYIDSKIESEFLSKRIRLRPIIYIYYSISN